MRRTLWPHLALAAVLLAGCSGDPEPKEPDSTTSPSPTTTPPPLPEAATQETAEGAATFVDHYLDVLNYAAHSGDTDALRRISDPDCAGCVTYANQFEERRDAGGSREGGVWSVGEVRISQFGGDIALVTELVSTAGVVRESSDGAVQEFNATSQTVTFVAGFATGSDDAGVCTG